MEASTIMKANGSPQPIPPEVLVVPVPVEQTESERPDLPPKASKPRASEDSRFRACA